MLDCKTHLRVFYTINASPYVLVRSLSPVSVAIIYPTLAHASPRYASVPLKACLNTICQSSPELVTREFSLYVLDPLEQNPPPVHMSNTLEGVSSATSAGTNEDQRGLPVGVGLMSLALTTSDHDSISVTGTWVKQPTGQEAVEVIFYLREIVVKQNAWDISSYINDPSRSQESSKAVETLESQPQQRYLMAQSSVSQTISDLTVSSIQNRDKAKAKAPKRHSNTPVTESDKLLSADTYIGPLKKKGRPKSTKSQSQTHNSQLVYPRKDVIVLDESDNENDAFPLQEQNTSTNKKRSSQPKPPPFTSVPLIRSQQNLVNSQATATKSEGVLLHHHGLLSDPASVDSTISLLTTLATIDSTKDHSPPQNAALVAALNQLLALYTKPTGSSTTTTSESRENRFSQPSSQGDENLIPDKENVNPSASKKGLGKGGLDKFSDPLPFVLNSSKERALQRLRPSTRTNDTYLIKETVVTKSSPIVRKRTLSDFMDERESGRKDKGKKRESTHKDSIRRQTLGADAMRHYPQALVGNLPRVAHPSSYYRSPADPLTSPVRGRPDDAENSRSKHLSSRNRQTVSASSPARKKYVIPEWAKTNTATRPRLSEEAKRTIEELQAKKREEKNVARKKLHIARSKTKLREPTCMVQAEPPNSVAVEEASLHPFLSDSLQGPISASSQGPMIAFPVRSSSPYRPPNISKTPKTPLKRKSPITGEDDSLFTPITESGSLFGGTPSRQAQCWPPQSILTSPLANRKKARISSGTVTSLHLWSGTNSPKVSTDSGGTVISDKDQEEILDGLDCPPSSLPIASSDIDIDLPCSPSTSTSAGADVDDDSEVQTVKQHWSGLPPSSPPPPSSPLLVPESLTDDEELDDLPIARSDSEADTDMSVLDTDRTPLVNPECSETEFTQKSMNLEGAYFTDLFPMGHDSTPPVSQPSSSFSDHLFDHFININAQSDDTSSSANSDVETMIQNGISDLDFAAFWEAFNPLVEENTQRLSGVEPSSDGFFGIENTLHEEIDRGRLADEMQSLLSGFLV